MQGLECADELSDSPKHYTDAQGHADRVRLCFGILLCAIDLIVGLLALKASPEAMIGSYGLIDALSPWYYIAIAVLLLSIAWTLGTERYRSPLLVVHLIVLVILVHGAPAIVESAPRLASAWVHTGFTNYVASNGKFLPAFDARFSWPSFFAGSALLDRAFGLNAASLLRWWPVALNLLYLPLVFRVAKGFLRSDARAWIATALFPLTNWVGQDYYSPQSIAFLLYLAFIYILIGPLGANGRPLWYFFRRSRDQDDRSRLGRPRPRRNPVPTLQSRQKSTAVGFYLGILVLLMAAMATGHQLTPIVATASASMLVLVGKTRVRWLVMIFVLITIGWICYGAVTYWSGHFGALVGGVGALQSNVGSSVGDRISGSSAHSFVVHVRLLMSLIVWLLALFGALVWRSQNENRLALVASFLVPFATLAFGNYGGEATLRVYLFSLPFAVSLIGVLISQVRVPYRQVTLAAVLFLIMPFLLISRWGNELFELARPNEVTAVRVLDRMANPGSTLLSITEELPWEFADIAKFEYPPFNLNESARKNASEIIDVLGSNPKGGYVIITTNDIVFASQAYGFPPTWGAELEALLSHSERFKLRYSNADAEIFQYVSPKGSNEK